MTSSSPGTDSGGAVSQGFPFVGGISERPNFLRGEQVFFFLESEGWILTRHFWGLPISFFVSGSFRTLPHVQSKFTNYQSSALTTNDLYARFHQGKRLSAKDFGAEVHICSSKPRWLGNHDTICATKINQWHMIEEVLHRLG